LRTLAMCCTAQLPMDGGNKKTAWQDAQAVAGNGVAAAQAVGRKPSTDR
jgi:hypothetical protein